MRVYIGSCIWRNVEVGHMKSLMGLLRQPGFAYYPQVGDALIERARGISATYFLRNTDYDVHLSIDSDIVGFTPADTLAVCEAAMTHKIVGGSYVCRRRDDVSRGDSRPTYPASFYENGLRVEHDSNHALVPVKWLATGFMAVHRSVFETLAGRMRLLHPSQSWAFYNFYGLMEYEDDDTGEPILLSEDYAFCQRAKEAGFGVWLDPAIRLGHMGSYIYRLEDTAQSAVDPQPLAITRNGHLWSVESMEKELVNAS